MSTNYLDLISYGAYGIKVADYNKVREVLVNQFKAIYGNDIDLSSTSADGQWIEQQALLFNNMLQMIKQLYSNINPQEASGEFLDIIAAYTNVIRRPATKSTVYVNLTGLANNQDYKLGNILVLLDKNGDTWECEPFTSNSNGEATVLARATRFGPIRADIGWIYTSVENIPELTVTMTSAAIPGQTRETDAELRARRDNSLSMKGTTVLESIVSNLLDVVGIEDVQIYNNDTGSAFNAKDSTNIPINSIYVVIRKNPNIVIDNSVIGSIIYEKKTPGITTVVAQSNDKEYNYPNELDVNQKVYWKESVPIAPTIEIKLEARDYFVSGEGENTTSHQVGLSAIEHLNNIRLSHDINHIELLSEVLYADPLYRGVPTYSITHVKINGSESNYTNPDTYFNYTTINISQTGNTHTITLS